MRRRSERKRVLVTGAAGFIGSHLCGELLRRGYLVTGWDNFSSGRLENIQPFLRSPHFTFVKKDITGSVRFKGSLNEIYNLAAIASPVGYQSRPIETLLVSSTGVKNLLDLAKEKKAKFLQASTSEVYGDPQQHPQKESYWGHVNPIGPRSCYDEGKRFAESLIFVCRRLFDLDTKVVRIFNTYGPRMHPQDGRVISNFISQALAGLPITVYGRGQQTRSFCYVSDMVRALILMMRSRESGPINLGNPGEFTILQLSRTVKRVTGSSSKIVHRDLPLDDPVKRRPDISLAKKALGWTPQVSLEEGLKLSLPYFEEVLEF